MSTNSLFDPVGHESIADAVVAQVETMIVDGILKEGRKIPSERELAEALGVSRPKLREALQILENRGLVTVRHGEGTFIAPLTGRAMSPALLSLYARHGSAFYDYLEYRREQEAFASRLAAQRATQSDKERIAEIIDEMQRAWKNDDQDASEEADFRLHAAVVDLVADVAKYITSESNTALSQIIHLKLRRCYGRAQQSRSEYLARIHDVIGIQRCFDRRHIICRRTKFFHQIGAFTLPDSVFSGTGALHRNCKII